MPLGNNVDAHAFNAERLSFLNIGKVAIRDLVPVKDHHLAAADRLHMVALCDHHAGILAQADTDGVGVAGHGLGQPAEPAALHKVTVDDDVVDEGSAGGHFHPALDQAG